jgi:YbbR domain-containing protein
MEGKEPERKMRKKLVRNFGLKLASLVLAFVLWFLVVQINDPLDSVTFNNVEIDLVNTDLLEQEGKVYEVIDESNIARVTVLAPRSVIGQIRKSDIVAEADMSKLTDINTIAVHYYVENLAVDSVDGNRDIVRLNVEDRASKWIRLTSSVVGDVAEGHLVTNVSLDQTTIEISGPQSVVSEVAYATVEMGVTGAMSNLSANVDIQLYDEEDQLILKLQSEWGSKWVKISKFLPTANAE